MIESDEGKWDYTEGNEPETQTHDYDPEELERARLRMKAEINQPDREYEYQKKGEANEVSPQEIANKFKQTWNWDLHNEGDLLEWMKKEGYDTTNWETVSELVRGGTRPEDENSLPLGDPNDPIYESYANESDSRHCETWKATDGKWYMELAVSSHNPDDYEYFGPYSSEESAWNRVIRNGRHSNPGANGIDDSGTRPPPSNPSRESYAKEKNPTAREWWEEEGWKDAEWQWGLKGYSTHWNELTWEQQDIITKKFNAMIDEEPTLFESKATEDWYDMDDSDYKPEVLKYKIVTSLGNDWGFQTNSKTEAQRAVDDWNNDYEKLVNGVLPYTLKIVDNESLAKEESTVSVSGPPAGTQPPANIWDELDKSNEEFINEGGVGSGPQEGQARSGGFPRIKPKRPNLSDYDERHARIKASHDRQGIDRDGNPIIKGEEGGPGSGRKPEGKGFGNDQQGRTEEDPLYGTGDSNPEMIRKEYEDDIKKFEDDIKSGAPKEFVQQKIDNWKEKIKTLNKKYPINEGGVGSGRKPEGTSNDEYDYLIGLVKNKEDWNRLPASVKQHYKIEDGKITRANEVVHYADEWWDSLSDSDRIYYADKINVRSDNNYEKLTVRERDAITDYFGEKIFSEYHGESYAKEGLDSWWGSLSGLEKQGIFDDWGQGYLSNPDSEQSWANYNYGDISWSQAPQQFKDWLVQNSYKYNGESKATEFQPERQGKRVKILTGNYKGQTGTIASVEIFGDGFTVRVDGVHNEYATGISLEPTDVEFLGGESKANEVKSIEDWWKQLSNTKKYELLEKHGYSQSNNFYEDWRYEDLPDTLQDALSVQYHNDNGTVNESKWKVNTITHGKINVDLGKDANEEDAINAVKRMYFDNEFIDDKDVLSAVKVGESKANEDFIESYFSDHSDEGWHCIQDNKDFKTREQAKSHSDKHPDHIVRNYSLTDQAIADGKSASFKKYGESKATEEQINSSTYHYDYSDYWNKGDSYVRSGLAMGAGLSTNISNKEWNELTKEEQTKILESGYATSYEMYDKVEEVKIPHQDINIHEYAWESMYGYGSATGRMSPVEDWNQGGSFEHPYSEIFRDFRGLKWSELPKDIQDAWKAERDYAPYNSESHVKSDVKNWLDKTFPTTYEEPQKGLDSEAVDDPEDIGLLSNLLDNELEEEKEGEDEEEDIAILLQLLAPNEKATEKGETYIFMWRKMDKGMREQMLIDVGINDSSASNTNWESLPEDHKDALKVKMNQLFRETGEESYKKKAIELDSVYKQFVEPTDSANGKGIMDSVRGYGTPEANGQDISQEEIIEKKPPKINYQYYKQYPFGRIQKGFYGEEGFGDQFGNIISKCKTCGFKGGIKEMIKHSDQTGHNDIDMLGSTKNQGLGFSAEVDKSWWENASYDEKAKELRDIGFGMGADIGDPENPLAKRSWDDLPNEARQQWGYFGNEVELSTMYQAKSWWDNKYPDRQWKDMNIGERQRTIMAFLRDPDTALEAKEGKYDCKKCKEKGYNMLANADTAEQARKHYEQYHDDEGMWQAQEVRITEITWKSMGQSSRRDLVMDAGFFGNSPDPLSAMKEIDDLVNSDWSELPDWFRQNLSGEADDSHFAGYSARASRPFKDINEFTKFCPICKKTTVHIDSHRGDDYDYCDEHPVSNEGGQGSGRKPYASKDPARKDKAHVGWKNQGIQNYLDKAEKDYETGKTSSPDEYEYAGYHNSTEQEAPATPSGNGGEPPAPPTNDMDEDDDDDKRRGSVWGYYSSKTCPAGQVYRDGKCRDKSNEADDNKCENCGREEDYLNDDGLCEDCEREAGIDREESKRDAYEGGKGSGKRGHQQWMRSLEEDPSYGECANCKVITEKVSGKCQMCGKKY